MMEAYSPHPVVDFAGGRNHSLLVASAYLVLLVVVLMLRTNTQLAPPPFQHPVAKTKVLMMKACSPHPVVDSAGGRNHLLRVASAYVALLVLVLMLRALFHPAPPPFPHLGAKTKVLMMEACSPHPVVDLAGVRDHPLRVASAYVALMVLVLMLRALLHAAPPPFPHSAVKTKAHMMEDYSPHPVVVLAGRRDHSLQVASAYVALLVIVSMLRALFHLAPPLCPLPVASTLAALVVETLGLLLRVSPHPVVVLCMARSSTHAALVVELLGLVEVERQVERCGLDR
jgi:hypothetical protein